MYVFRILEQKGENGGMCVPPFFLFCEFIYIIALFLFVEKVLTVTYCLWGFLLRFLDKIVSLFLLRSFWNNFNKIYKLENWYRTSSILVLLFLQHAAWYCSAWMTSCMQFEKLEVNRTGIFLSRTVVIHPPTRITVLNV